VLLQINYIWTIIITADYCCKIGISLTILRRHNSGS
jgi:hypothetical protein